MALLANELVRAPRAPRDECCVFVVEHNVESGLAGEADIEVPTDALVHAAAIIW